MAEEKKKPGRPRLYAGPNPKSGLKEAEKLKPEEVKELKEAGVSTPRANKYEGCGGFVWMTVHHNHEIQIMDKDGNQTSDVWLPIEGGDKIRMKIKVGMRVCVPRDVATILAAANDVNHPVWDQELMAQQLKQGGFGDGLRYVKKIRWPFSIEREATAEEFEEFASGKKPK